jgi:hypothetical protein
MKKSSPITQTTPIHSSCNGKDRYSELIKQKHRLEIYLILLEGFAMSYLLVGIFLILFTL